MNAVIEQTERSKIVKEATDIVQQAEAIKVTSQASWGTAGEFLKDIKTFIRKVDDRFDPILKKQRAALKEVQDMKKDILAKPKEAESTIKLEMGKFSAKMREKREEQERKAREKAEKEARERRERELAEAKKNKDKELEKELKEEPLAVEPVEQKRATPLHDGITTRQIWKAEVFDFKKLVEAVAKGEAPMNCLSANQKELDRMARESKEVLEIPGVKAYSEEVIGGAARKS